MDTVPLLQHIQYTTYGSRKDGSDSKYIADTLSAGGSEITHPVESLRNIVFHNFNQIVFHYFNQIVFHDFKQIVYMT